MILIFSPSSAAPHLHSFPTRRSSDLLKDADALPTCLLLPADYGHKGNIVRGLAWREIVDTNSISQSQAGDRKSTRLNSSHGYISYAVFCLKKKRVLAPAATPVAMVAP